MRAPRQALPGAGAARAAAFAPAFAPARGPAAPRAGAVDGAGVGEDTGGKLEGKTKTKVGPVLPPLRASEHVLDPTVQGLSLTDAASATAAQPSATMAELLLKVSTCGRRAGRSGGLTGKVKCPARRGLVANVGGLVSDLGSLILELDHFEDVYEEMCVSDCPAAPVGAAGTD